MKVVGTSSVYVIGEQAELREVVLNLIFNAVDAMPEGGVMEIGVRDESESGCFWVADTGCGMPAEVASRIFEPFFTTKENSVAVWASPPLTESSRVIKVRFWSLASPAKAPVSKCGCRSATSTIGL